MVTAALIEFIGLYMMIGKGGTFQKSDIRAVYDGSLFYRLRETRRPIIQAAAIDTSTGHLLTQNAMRAFERHLNTAVEHLPEATVSIVRSFVPIGSMLGGNVVATPVRQRKSLVSERISGTKTVSLDNQSFSLTGVQGYTSAPSVSSEEDLDVPDLVSEQSDSSDSLAELSALTGLRPDGADFYRDTPLTDWIGGQLSGVQKGTALGNPIAEDDESKNYSIPLAGVKNKRNAPLTDWLVEDYESDTKKPAVELQPVTLTGIARSSETAADASSSSDDNNKKVRFNLESVTLSGIRDDDTRNKMQDLPIVQAPSRVDKDLNFDLEPVTLCGLHQDDIIPQEVSKSLAIVDAPTLFDFEEVDFESYKQPVTLTGLASQRISDEHGPLPIVEAPTGLLKREKDLHFDPVAIMGVSQTDEMINKDVKRSAIPVVNVPVSFEPEDALFTGSNIATLTGVSSDADHELTRPVNKLEPVLLTGLRPVDTAPASFVEAPADYERKAAARLEPMSLSGLRSVDTTPATFVEAPNSFAPKEPATLEPISLSGLRSMDTAPATFVEAPTTFEPKKPVSLEPVLLSGLRSVDTDPATFVKAPANYEPKKIAALEPVSLSGLRSVDTAPAAFVEAPTLFAPKEPATIEPVSLYGLRSVDTTPASFVDAPANYKPKESVILEPMSLSGLRFDDTAHAIFVEAPTSFEPKEPVILEPVALSGLRSTDTEPAKSLEAPTFFEAKGDTLSGLRNTDDGPVGFVEVPTDFVGQEYKVEPVSLSGLSRDKTTAHFVEEPASYTPKEPVDFEPVVLANLRDAEFAAFVEEPKSYVPKQPVELEPSSLSGVHMQSEVSDVGFVEVPTDFVGQEYTIETVSLKGLSKDATFASFVEEPAFTEKEPVDLEELAKPVPLSGLSASFDDFSASVEEPASYKPKEPVQIEPVSLSGLNAKNETWGNVEEPEWYKPKEPVQVEHVQLSGILSDELVDRRWTIPAKKQERRSSLDQPLLDGEVDALVKWREGAGFEGVETADVDLIWRWREESGFETHMPRLEAIELCGIKAISSDIPIGNFPIVEDPYPSAHVEMPFEPYPIDIIGLSEDPQARLKNHLNIGPLPGVSDFNLYEDPIELPEQVQEQVDIEQYRRAFPLSGIHSMEEGAVKNWLNTGALPGVNQEVSVYEPASNSLPADYIEPRPKDDYDDVGRLAAGISNKKLKKPLKNWLNTKPLPYTESSKLYQEAKPEPEPIEMEIDLGQYRVPFPLSGLTDDEIKHKNWLNNNCLPGVQSASKSSYQEAGPAMPEDYIEPRDPSLEDDSKALQGVNASETNLRLKNWLSATDLPGVQAGDRVYDEAKELSPSEYIQPPTEDQEFRADFKLTGVAPHDDLSELGSTPPKLHHDSEDEQSIATESTVPAPMSPTELKHKRSPSAQKLAMTSGNWSAMTDITSLKEE
ncbi:hypothetical protein BJV82DRAFT_310346 [Fennellomyces sp. T-0311]|nr:hypothetical protein BJV82DRAFT_310346 [Fennellomyces sp. T-0311]